MGFTDAVKSFYRRYFDFSTRSSRSEFWWVQLFMLLVFLIFGTMFVTSINWANPENSNLGIVGILGVIGLFLFILANIIPGIALAVRRLHDLDKSGWLYLIVIIGGFIPFISIIVSIGWIIVNFFRGTVGDNRFGPDPLGDSLADTFD